jgi:hypothetical protein
MYEQASGQKMNLKKKSSILFSKNTSLHTQHVIRGLLGIDKVGGDGMYLGLPELVGRNKHATFSQIKHRVHDRVHAWENRFLSTAGKERLLKLVALALPNYAMSAFLLPKSLCNDITSILQRFFWSKQPGRKGVHWMAWQNLSKCKKKEGGLNFRDLLGFHLAMLAKIACRL